MSMWYTNPSGGGMFGFIRNAEVIVKDPAKVLGIPKGSDRSLIKKAFRLRAFATHPDRGGDAEEFMRVNKAYQMAMAGDWGGKARAAAPRAPVGTLNKLLDKAKRAVDRAMKSRSDAHVASAAEAVSDFVDGFVDMANQGALSDVAINRFRQENLLLQRGLQELLSPPQEASPPPPPPPRPRPDTRKRKYATAGPTASVMAKARVVAKFKAAEASYNAAVDSYNDNDLARARRQADQAFAGFGKAWGMVKELDGPTREGFKPGAKSLFEKIKKIRAALGAQAPAQKAQSFEKENKRHHEAARKGVRKARTAIKRRRGKEALKWLSSATQHAEHAIETAGGIRNKVDRKRRRKLAQRLVNEIQGLKLEADDIIRGR